MKKREERDAPTGSARVQRTVRSLAFVRSRGSCECDKTWPPLAPCENTRKPEGVALIAPQSIMAAFATKLGPAQMARHLRGGVSAETMAYINRRHVTTERLDAANRDIIDRFSRCVLPRCWGDEKRGATDGTHYELAEENVMAE